MIDITITIAGVDRTAKILSGSVTKTDNIDSGSDILTFRILSHPGQTYLPAINDEVIVTDGATRIYGGTIVQIDKEQDEAIKSVTHTITCKDYGQYLTRRLIVERVELATVEDTIAFLLLKYAPEFDDLYVDCPIDITSIAFNNISVAAALDKLSKLTNYQWYADYDMHLHFYEKNTEPAPFDIVDADGNYIPETLSIKEDLTQIKNRITIKGGEVEVNSITYQIKGSKAKAQDNGHRTLDLSYKFSKKPDVSLNATPLVVGIVGYDDSADFDVMWSYEQKYLEFIVAVVDADDIEVTGTPLEIIQVRVQDTTSIGLYGRWDSVISVPGIKTRDEALQYAQAERDAYKDPQYDASFDTYQTGLRSGQIINITSTQLGIDEDFLIQRVVFKMINPDTGYWHVEAATLRSINLIDILARIVGNVEADDLAQEALLSYLEFSETINLVESAPVFSKKSGPYQVWPSVGSGTGAAAIVNFSTTSS